MFRYKISLKNSKEFIIQSDNNLESIKKLLFVEYGSSKFIMDNGKNISFLNNDVCSIEEF